MLTEHFYDIHSIVRLQVKGDASILHEVDLHLASFRCNHLDSPPDVLIDRYDVAPATQRTTVVDDYDYGAGAYHRAATRVRFDILGTPQTYHMDVLNLPVNLIVQLALMRKGYTFLHGAGLSLDGRRVLLPAYPGTGKTTLVAAFVRSGAQLFGDDFCIVGNCAIYSYPQALSVYPHHLSILGYNDHGMESAFRKTALLDYITAPLAHRTSRPAKLARVILSAFRTPSVNVAPERVFGQGSITKEGRIDEVVALERSGEIATIVREPVDIAALADQATAVLWHEWHASFHDLLLYDALAESGKGTIGRFRQVHDLFLQVFQSVPCSRVRIPAAWDNTTLVREFLTFWKRDSE
jgi:hypothetical protein